MIQDLTDVDSTQTFEEEVYSGFSLPPGSYPSLNVYYTEGTPSRFWLTISSKALGEFNSLIKVSSLFLFVFQSLLYFLFRSY